MLMNAYTPATAQAFPRVPGYQPRAAVGSAPTPDMIARMAANDAQTQTQAEAQPQAQAERREIYHLVHKGLRAAMSDALVRLGRVDLSGLETRKGALDAVTDLLHMCREHVEHENAFLHTAMEKAVPGSSQVCTADHGHHVTAIRNLETRIEEARRADPQMRERAFKVLYRLLASFVAENFAHMEIEESSNTELLWRHYSDADILSIEHQIHAAIKPERMMHWLRWILPNVNRQQRAVMMRGMQAGMPPELFGAVLDMVKPHLSEFERAALALDLA
jgi:hypothetical protein